MDIGVLAEPAMSGSYVERLLDLTFQLGKGSFGDSGFDTVKFSGLRISAQIDKANMPTPGATALIRIYGMTLSQMNELSVAGLLWDNKQNKVRLLAGDAQSGMSEVFNGDIVEAYPSLNEGENTSFVVRALPGVGIMMKPVKPTSIAGSVDAAQALETILKPTEFKVENSGVTAKLADPYFPGTVWEQASRCVKAADCFGNLDSTAGVLAIWPKNGSRKTDSVPEISAATGMIGYPEFQQVQVTVRTLLDTSIRPGTKIRIKSGLSAADGEWNITRIVYMLASKLVNGPWEMSLIANREIGQGATNGGG